MPSPESPQFPPHLPPPSVSIELHRRFAYLKIFIAVILVAVIAGLSGAAMMLGWVWPRFGAGDLGASFVRTEVSRSGILGFDARRALNSTLGRVYSKMSELGSAQFFANTDLLGPALVIGSDGWLVMQHSGSIANLKNWRIVFGDNSVYRPLRGIPDSRANLLYLNIEPISAKGEPLRPALFRDSPELPSSVSVWDGKNWHSAALEGSRVHAFNLPHSETTPVFYWELGSPMPDGSVVVASSGAVLGVVRSGALVLPAKHLERVWASVRAGESATYPSLGIEGWFGEEQPIFSALVHQRGFLVVKSLVPSLLKPGDTILEVGGVPFSEDSAWGLITPPAVRLKILRATSTLEVTVPVKSR